MFSAGFLIVLLPWLAIAQEPSEIDLMNLAHQNEKNGRLAEAERLYERVLAGNLNSQEAHHRLGVLAARGGVLERSINHFATAEGLGPPSVQLLNDYGAALCLKGDLTTSESKLRAALAIDPASEQAQNNLKLVLVRRHRIAQARSASIFRQLAERRAAEESRAAAEAIADAQMAARVRQLAEARKAAEMRLAYHAISDVRKQEIALQDTVSHIAGIRNKIQGQSSQYLREAKTKNDGQAGKNRTTKKMKNALRKQFATGSPADLRTEENRESKASHSVFIELHPAKVMLTDGEIEVAVTEFGGVKPGTTTLANLQKVWGRPKTSETRDGVRFLSYDVEPNGHALVELHDNVVTRITIGVGQNASSGQWEEKFELTHVRCVEIFDEQGRPSGRAYPERGVIFSYQQDAMRRIVAQVFLEKIDPKAFVLRAESDLHGRYTENLSDLDHAIQLSPGYAEAHWRKAQILLVLGKSRSALGSIESALKSNPRQVCYLLTKARCLADQAKFIEAVEQVNSAMAAQSITSIEKAQAVALLAALAHESPGQDFAKASSLYIQAIKLAEPLSTDPTIATRRAALAVMIDAHLGAARCIGWGKWRNKSKAVPLWLVDAERFTRSAIKLKGMRRDLRLRIIEATLRAHGGFDLSLDPEKHLQAAESIATEIWKESEDPLNQQQLSWQMGLIYAHAIKLAVVRKKFERAVHYAERARTYLERSQGGARSSSKRARYVLGYVYYWTGALRAMHQDDHKTTLHWYSKAASFWAPEGNENVFHPAEAGNALVGMGEFFWQMSQKQMALEIIENGAKLLKQAVDLTGKDRNSLVAAYTNLTKLHLRLGNKQRAEFYEKRARALQE